MEKRRVIHEAIAEEMHSKRAAKEQAAASHAQHPKLITRPVLIAVATA